MITMRVDTGFAGGRILICLLLWLNYRRYHERSHAQLIWGEIPGLSSGVPGRNGAARAAFFQCSDSSFSDIASSGVNSVGKPQARYCIFNHRSQ